MSDLIKTTVPLDGPERQRLIAISDKLKESNNCLLLDTIKRVLECAASVDAPTQGADARPVAITDEVLYKLWALALDSTEHEFKASAPALLATRDAAPSDAQLHIAADEVIRIANAYFGIYPQDDPMRVDFKAAVFNASREFSKDARRYQALRDRDLDALKKGGVFAGMIPENVVINGADLDAAADKLLSASAPMEKTS